MAKKGKPQGEAAGIRICVTNGDGSFPAAFLELPSLWGSAFRVSLPLTLASLLTILLLESLALPLSSTACCCLPGWFHRGCWLTRELDPHRSRSLFPGVETSESCHAYGSEKGEENGVQGSPRLVFPN